MKTLIAAAIISIASISHAGPEVMGLHLGSWHENKSMNNVNPGFYARWSSGLTAGAYYNSEENATAYLGWTFHDKADRFAITLGAATGYERAKLVPFVIPSVRFGLTKDTSARLSLVPLKDQAAIHFSLEKRF